MHILALDVGTSSVKAAVLDTETAKPVGLIARAGYPLLQPTPEAAVLDPDSLWSAVLLAGREASAGHRPQGVGISCLTPGLILTDAAGEPLTPLITHLDRRARVEARTTWESLGHEFLASTGNKPLPGGISALAYLHLKRTHPFPSELVRWYLHVNGWLGLRLTGVAAFDSGNASFTGLYDTMGSRDWSSRWCGLFGVNPEWLPPVRSGNVTLGPLQKQAADILGIPAGIPVKLGTADTSCAMLAAGMVAGDLLHVVGTTQVLAAFTRHPHPSPRRLTRLLGVGEAFIQVTHNPVGGVALDWMHGLCFQDQEPTEYYERTLPQALQRTTSVTLDPPFIGGDRLEIDARTAGFQGLGLASNRMDLLAAVLQAMADHHQTALDALGLPEPPQRVFLTGGGAEVVRMLIPAYQEKEPVLLEEGSLRGVAQLFTG